MKSLKELHEFSFSLTNLFGDGGMRFETLALFNASDAYAIQRPEGTILKVIFNSPEAMQQAKKLAINWEVDEEEDALLTYMKHDYIHVGKNSFSCFISDAERTSIKLLVVSLSSTELMLELNDGYIDEDVDCNDIPRELVIKGIQSVSYCGLCMRIHFNSTHALKIAKQQTGWEGYDELSLIMSGFNDFIITHEPCEITGSKNIYYYGDWQLKPLLSDI